MHLSGAIPANDTRKSVFGLRNFPLRERRSNLGPLAPEASALTTELPRLLLTLLQVERVRISQAIVGRF